jgi:5-methylcytosine-specific restriction endonuclease McrA
VSEGPDQGVRILEVIQAGDVFLLVFKCPGCGEKQVRGYPLSKCQACPKDLAPLEVVVTRAERRLLTGSVRKHRLGKRKIQKLMTALGGACAYCYKRLEENFHVEHIVPLAVGGTNDMSNLTLACPECNLVAGSKYFNSFELKQRYVLARKKQRGSA